MINDNVVALSLRINPDSVTSKQQQQHPKVSIFIITLQITRKSTVSTKRGLDFILMVLSETKTADFNCSKSLVIALIPS